MSEKGSDQGDFEPDNGDVGAKTTLPEILSYNEIDRLLLAIEDLEDLVAVWIMPSKAAP